MSQDQIDVFQQRLSRITDPRNKTWTDPETGMDIPRRMKRPPRAKKSELLENLGYPLSFVLSFLIGMLAVLGSRYVRWHLLGMSADGADADVLMMIDGGIAAALGFVLQQVLWMRAPEHVTAQVVGVFAMICVMHNLMWWYPEEMAIVFGPDYVKSVMAYTEPNSLLFRGVSFAW